MLVFDDAGIARLLIAATRLPRDADRVAFLTILRRRGGLAEPVPRGTTEERPLNWVIKRPLNTQETEGQMLQRVMPDLMGKNILVINDEAHHCYREKPKEAD